jgi:signal transduction histidine kinase
MIEKKMRGIIMNSLQARLLFSFFFVITLTLCVISFILLLLVRSRPVPIDGLINDLTREVLDVNVIDQWQDWRDNSAPRDRRADTETFVTDLVADAEAVSDDRILIMRNDNIVVYDSSGEFKAGERIRVSNYQTRATSQRNVVETRMGSGIFVDDGQEWVFASQRLQLDGPRNRQEQQPITFLEFVIAAPRPEPTGRYLLNQFGDTFLIPLCQAGIVGFVLAFLFSIGLSRSIARPLQAVSSGAAQVASGDYNHQVPVRGPTEVRLLAQTFNDMTTQVRDTQQAQQDFLANVTHDLRTPLTSIQGFSQAIVDGMGDNQHAAQIIYDEAGRMGRMVEELLDLARIQSGKMQMLSHAVEIDRLLRAVGESLTIKAQQKNIQLEVDIPPLFRIAGDGDRLMQVFTNLVDNAIKHTESGGYVWLRAKPHDSGIQIEIQDTGEGIPPEDVSRIFERFYQVDKSRNRQKQGGTGLGLAITYEIIQAHNGRITVESQAGVGSVFRVWLPALTTDHSTIITRRR